MENTCQICGRVVKATKGITSHHGYRRPEYGWQTKSCKGARHLPYEVSCDLIPNEIAVMEAHIQKVFSKLESFILNPPATIEYEKSTYLGFGKHKYETMTAVRPEGFDNTKRLYYSQYEATYFSVKRAMEQDLKHSNFQLDFLKERLANWKAVS